MSGMQVDLVQVNVFMRRLMEAAVWALARWADTYLFPDEDLPAPLAAVCSCCQDSMSTIVVVAETAAAPHLLYDVCGVLYDVCGAVLAEGHEPWFGLLDLACHQPSVELTLRASPLSWSHPHLWRANRPQTKPSPCVCSQAYGEAGQGPAILDMAVQVANSCLVHYPGEGELHKQVRVFDVFRVLMGLFRVWRI